MHQVKELILLYVFVLLKEAIYIIDDVSRVVFDPELYFPSPAVISAKVIDMRFEFRVKFIDISNVFYLWYSTFICQKTDNALRGII